MGPSAPSCRLGAPRPSLVLGAQHRDALRSSSGPGCPIPTIAVPPHTHKAPPAQPLEERTQRKGKGAVGQLRLHGKQNPWSREGVRDASSQVSRPGQAFWSPTPPHPLALRWPCAHLEGRPGLQLCPHILHLYWLLLLPSQTKTPGTRRQCCLHFIKQEEAKWGPATSQWARVTDPRSQIPSCQFTFSCK